MNCHEWKSHIALFVEGDLAPSFAEKVDLHLRSCAPCRGFAEELRDSQSIIRELRNEVIDSTALNRVRANVLAEIRTIEERRTWLDRLGIWFWNGFSWRYAVLGSVALVLLSIIIWRLSLRPVQTPAVRQAAAVPQVIQRETVPVAETKAVSLPKRPRRRIATPAAVVATVDTVPASKVEDEVMKIFTDDPNVVIYWVIDQKSGGF